MIDSKQGEVNEEPIVLCIVERNVNSWVHADVSLLSVKILTACVFTIIRVVPSRLLVVGPLRVIEVSLSLRLEVVAFREGVLVSRLL